MRLLFLVVLALSAYPHFGYAAKKVLLSSVQTLTLHSDKFTTGRRSSPIPQLRCVDGRSSCKTLPAAVQCYNMGSDGIDVQWKCEAQLPKNSQFDSIQVQCEGYDYPDDPYILAGSCGLTYTLKPVGSGSSSSSSHKRHHQRSSSSKSQQGNTEYSSFIVVILFFGAAYAIYTFCLAPSRQAGEGPGATAPPPYGRVDRDDAPPPYTEGDAGGPAPQYGFRPEYSRPGSKAPTGGAAHAAREPTAAPNADDGNAGSGFGGFWSGAAVGGIAGYLFGNSGNRGGGYGGRGYGGGYRYDQGWGGGSRYHDYGGRAACPPSSSSSSASDEPVTRTGYASTRRR